MTTRTIKDFAILYAFEAYLPNGTCLQAYKKEVRVIGPDSTTTTRFRSAALAQTDFMRRVNAEPVVATCRERIAADVARMG